MHYKCKVLKKNTEKMTAGVKRLDFFNMTNTW